MRDKIKDGNYFDNFITEDSERIKKFSDKLQKGEVKSERIFPVRAKVHDLKLGVIIAKYSRGDSLSLLEDEYFQLIKEWKDVFQPDYYNKNLKMISLAILFNVDNSTLRDIDLMLRKADISDWLFDFLLNSPDGKKIEETEGLLFPEAFNTLKEAAYAEDKIGLLEKYLVKEWYNRDCGCYEAHKSKQNIYYGYWSFEAGAVAKILNLNDDALKDTNYYPYDLVHYKK